MAFIARHAGVLILVLAGLALRVAVTVAYWPAFWYRGDSGAYLSQSTLPVHLDVYWALGYVAILKLLHGGHAMWTVAALQHLIGIAVAVTVYVYLQRRGVSRWIATVAAAPLLLDSFVIAIEHYVLADTLYAAALFAAVVSLVRRTKPGPVSCTLAGLTLAAAWLVKPLALVIAPVLLAYVMIRRVGWLPGALFASAFLVPFLAVQLLAHGGPTVYGPNDLALYGRTASFANCATLRLSAAERAICPAARFTHQRPDWYAFDRDSPVRQYRVQHEPDAPVLRAFAWAVVTQQTGDYVRVVARELGAHLVPGVNAGDAYQRLWGRYTLPATVREDPVVRCTAELAKEDFSSEPVALSASPPPTRLSRGLASYARHVRTPRGVLGAALLITAVAAVWPRDGDRTARRDAIAMAVVAAAVIVPAVLVGMYEPRYALPALPFACLAGAMAAHRVASGHGLAALTRTTRAAAGTLRAAVRRSCRPRHRRDRTPLPRK